MSTVINYQLGAHMSLLAHIDIDSPVSSSHGNQSTRSIISHTTSKEDFWSPPDSPTQVDNSAEEEPTTVATDICISLKKPSPELEQDSEEFKRQAKEIKKDIQRISKYSSRHARKKSKSPYRQVENVGHAEERLKYEHEFRRRLSVNEGRGFLLDFLTYHFTEHVENITIKSNKSIEEIKMIGNEDLSVGVRQCRRLFNAPVISDQVGLLLWQELSQPDAMDHSHEFCTDDEAEKDNLDPDIVRKKRAVELAEHMTEYIEERRQQQATARSSAFRQTQCQSERAASWRPTTSGPSRVRAQTMPGRMADAMNMVASQNSTSIPMEKTAIDGFLEGVKRSALKGATQLAASLATGYT